MGSTITLGGYFTATLVRLAGSVSRESWVRHPGHVSVTETIDNIRELRLNTRTTKAGFVAHAAGRLYP